MAEPDTYMPPEHGWTCFHCGDTFTCEKTARTHFGATPDAVPGCLLRMQEGDRPMLRLVRSLEADVAKLRAEAEDDYSQRYYSRVESDIRGTAPAFKECRTLRDVFNLFDSMEGRALAAEEQISLGSPERNANG